MVRDPRCHSRFKKSSDRTLIISHVILTHLSSKLRRTNLTEYKPPRGSPVFKMGGGDLNLKKSWHPGRAANVTRLLKEEAKAREERKKIEERRREIATELALLEVRRMQEGNGKKVVRRRMDWMVPGSLSATEEKPKEVQLDEEREAFLLGRPRKAIEEMKQGGNTGRESVKLERGLEESAQELLGAKFAFSLRKDEEKETLRKHSSNLMSPDTAAVARNKVLLDPLFQIKRQEKRKHEEMTREREVDERRPRKEIKRHKREERERADTKRDSNTNRARYSHN
jgi:N-terminal domain of CBF1 interacting co-repressor CIR/Pre-mRNA splicing factor